MTQLDELGVVCRGKTEEDLGRIFSDWLRSNRDAPGLKVIPSETYYYSHHRILESLWNDPTAAWVLAVSKDDPTFVYAWACAQQATTAAGSSLIVHYVYTRQKFRRFGIASRLLSTIGAKPDFPLVTTAHSYAGRELVKSFGAVELHNPYLIFARYPLPEVQARVHSKQLDRAVKASRSSLAFNGFPRGEPPTED